MSVLLNGCTTWILMKHIKKKLDGNDTRSLVIFWAYPSVAYIYIYIYIYIYWIHTDAMITNARVKDAGRKTQEDFFTNIFTSHFVARVRKGCSRFACERVLETEHKLHILTPLLWPSRCVFLVLLDAQPEVFRVHCWTLAFFTASYQHLLWTQAHQGFKPHRPGVAFLITSRLQLSGSLLATPLAPRTQLS